MAQEDKPPQERLASLDALRGFDMFWIIGGAGMVVALAKVLGFPQEFVEGLAKQMTHVKWDGFRFFDLIFPLFVFMTGLSVPYSILSKYDKGVSTLRLQLGIIKRSTILILLGLSFSVFKFQPEVIRLYTVLWLIGMSYLIGASITLHVESWKRRLVVFFVVLLAYHLAMFYLPFPGKEAGITPENNLAAWVDRNFIQTNLYRGVYDPEGSIRVITGGMLCMLGGLVGERVRWFGNANIRCSGELAGAGLTCLLLGWIWSFAFPMIKDLWSPSFVLWAAGLSLLLMCLFYTVIDVWKQRWIGWVFLPIGMNAIVIYVSQWYVPWHGIRDFFFRGYAKTLSEPAQQNLVMFGGLVMVQWLILFWLYRRKIFIRV
ncbi:MAG: acyltransferase family protein [Akkermansiaceae bacterium]